MNCPKCNHKQTSVIDSRPLSYGTYRRRKCDFCHERFSTVEEEVEAKRNVKEKSILQQLRNIVYQLEVKEKKLKLDNSN